MELGLSRLCVQRITWTPRTLFFDSLDTQILCQDLLIYFYNTDKAVTGLKSKICKYIGLISLVVCTLYTHKSMKLLFGYPVSKSWLRL